MSRLLFGAALLALVTSPAFAQKKQIVVTADQSARQVNNHPYSYTTPGHANTNCSSNGTINATGTTSGNTTNINGTTNTDTNCSTTYRPPQTTSGNIVTVNNASWVRDIATGDRYLIQCTAHWVGSKCSYLEDGQFTAVLDGNTMSITGMKGMKEMTAKYHVVRYVPGNSALSGSSTLAIASTQQSSGLTAEERFAWKWYLELPKDDKDYVDEYCPSNPTGRALLPHAKVMAGEPAERAFYCQPWLAAKGKQN